MKRTNLILIASLIISAFGQSQEPISDADYKALLEKSPFNSVYPKNFTKAFPLNFSSLSISSSTMYLDLLFFTISS